MKYFLFLSLLWGTVVYAAEEKPIKVIIRQVLKDDPLVTSRMIMDDNHPHVVTERTITLSKWLGLVAMADEIRSQANVEGDIISIEQDNDSFNNVIFQMRSHRKNPDTRNAE
jgi:hypothetical protein